MKWNAYLACFITFILCHPGFSQQLTPSVIASSGGFYSNANGYLSFTVGEMAAVETYNKPSGALTQGFQQPWDLGTYTEDHPFFDLAIRVYPNPTDGKFNLLSEADSPLDFTLVVSDILGREIYQQHAMTGQGQQVLPVDIAFAPQGTYLLTLRVHDPVTDAEEVFVHKITLVK